MNKELVLERKEHLSDPVYMHRRMRLHNISLMRQYRLEMCQQWLVHEDGALAYQLQNKEIDFHYGLNRYNRRTIRDDIPVARVVQDDEEVIQQQERFQELEALKAQAEEDEEVARRVTEELMSEEEAHKRQRELEDEEVARTVQEKEKKKYEKYIEKQRLKELKTERKILEKQLEQHTQDARLTLRSSQDEGTSDEDVGDVQHSMGDMAVSGRNSRSERNGYTRYMYRVTPSGRIEDEGDFTDFFAVPDNIPEEHRSRLQQLQDEELARLLQEQEHKRTKAEVDRVKLREIEEQDERLAKIIQEQEKLRAKRAKEKKKQQDDVKRQQQQMQMTNPATRPLPDLPGKRISSDPPVNRSHDHHRLRRDSFIQSIENRSSQQPRTPESEQSTTSSRNSQRQPSRQQSLDPLNRPRLPTPNEVPSHSVHSVEQWVLNSARETQNYQHERRRLPSNRSDEMIPSPSPPGSYHSEDELPYSVIRNDLVRAPPPPSNPRVNSQQNGNHYAVSNPLGFNIAAAIDPTYKRQPRNGSHDETNMKMPVLSSSMPLPEDRMGGANDSFSEEGPVISQFQPVQGQRRSASDKQKTRKSSIGNSKKDKQGNCKQQ
ncbi:trichohyalin-like isoform X9 [Mytilus californianus]|uniref:trichohyalin-like isoform X9 n=1 Tax=Mytilus californianus TaxID=6549 RepID=UPI0022453FC3|nr:trichohyalin-like isoform X9 [Mytilus californianus]